jgi:flavin-binding protein dodecin
MEDVMSVYTLIEVIGSSATSWEDAAAQAIKTAGETLHDLRVAEVVKQDIHLEDGGAILPDQASALVQVRTREVMAAAAAAAWPDGVSGRRPRRILKDTSGEALYQAG